MKLTVDHYRSIREAIISYGFQHEIDWAENLKAPACADDMAFELIWVICNSGMRFQIAQKIYAKVESALKSGKTADSAFGHKLKAKAMDGIWKYRDDLFKAFGKLGTRDEKLAWCEKLPHIGPITKYHAAKNLGMNIAKPDRWLQRVADESGEGVQEMCLRLSTESGDRVATVDLVIWRACNLGIFKLAPVAMTMRKKAGEVVNLGKDD